MASRFGRYFTITTFGESHGAALGVIIDGCPAGLAVDLKDVQSFLDRRKPGVGPWATSRKEADQVAILSGVEEGFSTGAPITLMVQNKDIRANDYQNIEKAFRPSHGDYTTFMKYGRRAKSGGGRTSARETVARVAAGAIAKAFLAKALADKVSVVAFIDTVGPLVSSYDPMVCVHEKALIGPLRALNEDIAEQMMSLILKTKEQGDSVGGTISCQITGVPAGLGEPVFDKLEADLAKAMLSIPACKAFEVGSGFAGCGQFGSMQNDSLQLKDGQVSTKTNHSGGIQAGISNGQMIYFRVGFKPVATISKPQVSLDENLNSVSIEAKGRHDPCVLPRALVIVEAMAWLVLADHLLAQKVFT